MEESDCDLKQEGQVCDLLHSQGAWMPRRHEKSGAAQELLGEAATAMEREDHQC